MEPSVGSNLVTLAEAGSKRVAATSVWGIWFFKSRRTVNKCAIDIDAGLEAITRLLSRSQGHGDHESRE